MAVDVNNMQAPAFEDLFSPPLRVAGIKLLQTINGHCLN
jgi:hypothetical protein